MGIPEPSSPLWAAVKAIHDSWPPDDEVVARDVGGVWRRGGDVVAQGASDTARASGDALVAWRDAVGMAFHGRVGEYTRTVSQVHQQTLALATRGEHYAGELESAKNAITSTIAANEDTYALLGNPMLGALAPALQTTFATAIATHLQGMIAEKAAALRANPTGTPPPSPPPPDSSPPDGLDDLAAGGLRRWGEFDQLVSRSVGEFADDVIDGAGERGGDILRGLANLSGNQDLARQGDEFQAAADAEGDRVAEEALGVGADNAADIFDAATAIDGDREPATVYIDRERFPESAAHIDDAQSGTSYRGHGNTAYPGQQPSELTIDRGGANQNRTESLRGLPTERGYDRDEYPPAVFKEGGEGASVRYINPSDNRGAGASMGNQMRRWSAEDSVDRQTRRLEDGESVIIETS